MKLTYRGLNYDYSSTSVNVNGDKHSGKYRGRAITFRTLKSSPIHEADHELTYRGIHFRGHTAS